MSFLDFGKYEQVVAHNDGKWWNKNSLLVLRRIQILSLKAHIAVKNRSSILFFKKPPE